MLKDHRLKTSGLQFDKWLFGTFEKQASALKLPDNSVITDLSSEASRLNQACGTCASG